jgi:hypothetical protein
MTEPKIPADHEAEIDNIVTGLTEDAIRGRHSHRDTQIVLLAAKGLRRPEIAAAHDVHISTVQRCLKRHKEPLEQLQVLFRHSVLSRGVEREEELTTALLNTATDGSNRNQASAARVWGELSGVIGNRQAIHFGDNIATLNLNHERHLEILARSPAESRTRLRELEEGFGLAKPEATVGG